MAIQGIGDFFFPLARSDCRELAGAASAAEFSDRAGSALWLAGETDGCAQFHHGLIEIAGAGGIEKQLGCGPQGLGGQSSF